MTCEICSCRFCSAEFCWADIECSEEFKDKLFEENKKLKLVAETAEKWIRHLESKGGHYYDGIPGELIDAIENWKNRNT